MVYVLDELWQGQADQSRGRALNNLARLPPEIFLKIVSYLEVYDVLCLHDRALVGVDGTIDLYNSIIYSIVLKNVDIIDSEQQVLEIVRPMDPFFYPEHHIYYTKETLYGVRTVLDARYLKMFPHFLKRFIEKVEINCLIDYSDWDCCHYYQIYSDCYWEDSSHGELVQYFIESCPSVRSLAIECPHIKLPQVKTQALDLTFLVSDFAKDRYLQDDAVQLRKLALTTDDSYGTFAYNGNFGQKLMSYNLFNLREFFLNVKFSAVQTLDFKNLGARNLQKVTIVGSNIVLTNLAEKYLPYLNYLNAHECHIDQLNLPMLRSFIIKRVCENSFGHLFSSFKSLKEADLQYQLTDALDSFIMSKVQNVNKLIWAFSRIDTIQNTHYLSDLAELDLSSNFIDKIENLEPLTALYKLSLSRNRIAKIENVNHLVDLEVLSLSGNRNITVIENIGNLLNLAELELYGCSIEKIENLKNCVSLKKLNLGRNRIKKLENLDVLTQLRLLDVSCNEISRIENLGLLSNVHILNLSRNRGITKIENLGRLGSLFELDLSRCKIEKIENLEHQRCLQVLKLDENNIQVVENLDALTLCLRELSILWREVDTSRQDFSKFESLVSLNIKGETPGYKGLKLGEY